MAYVSSTVSVPVSKPKAPNASLLSIFWGMTKTLLQVVPAMLFISFLVHFPYHTDVVERPVISQDAGDFYTRIYASTDEQGPDNAADYVKIAKEAIAEYHIVPRVADFVKQYGLEKKRILDVGAGTGYLQDVVDDYVGLDISTSARSYFHKPYVQASATEMPFHDNEFDALWSIWVLEHVPKPEQALVEIRRVVKDGGLLYLEPAWNCNPWAAEGYTVRPFSDFGLKGKLIKASLPVVSSAMFRMAYIVPARFVRGQYAHLSKTPTRLHYTLLEPNYSHYWVPDSDALNDLDFYETMLWFTSRGDECLNCVGNALMQSDEMVIRVHKQATP
jgi:SAM-dependent methyltransferase